MSEPALRRSGQNLGQPHAHCMGVVHHQKSRRSWPADRPCTRGERTGQRSEWSPVVSEPTPDLGLDLWMRVSATQKIEHTMIRYSCTDQTGEADVRYYTISTPTNSPLQIFTATILHRNSLYEPLQRNSSP